MTPTFTMALACGLLAVAGCGGADDEATSPPPTKPADCSPARPMPAPPADEPQTFAFDGQDRTYLISLPDDYDGTAEHPLVLGFHGHGGTSLGAAVASELGEQGPERGYIVVFPQALGAVPAWNFGADPAQANDFAFVDALVGDLSERLCVDADRIYAAGHSNGSAFTGFLACQPSYRFAAVAMVSAFIPSTCPVDEAVPAVMAVHGTADPGVPYDGGSVAGGPTVIPPALETLDAYRDHYDCDPTPVESEPQPGVESKAYEGCLEGSEAVLVTIAGGGHEWPLDKFPATAAILDFFDTHTRAG